MTDWDKMLAAHKEVTASKELKERVQKIMRKKNNSVLRVIGSIAAGFVAATVIFVGALNVSPVFAKSMSGVISDDFVKVLTFGRYEYNVEDDGFVAEVDIPKIEGLLDKELEDTLNAAFQDNANAVIAEFEANVKELQQAFPNEEVNMGVKQGFIIKTDNADILAMDVYLLSVAGSSSTVHSFYTVDKNTRELLTLSGLFKDGADYVTVLSDYLVQTMREANENEEYPIYWVDDDMVENFESIKPDQNFYINNDGQLVICFDKYEVAPGAYGSPEFVIPIEVIKDIAVYNLK